MLSLSQKKMIAAHKQEAVGKLLKYGIEDRFILKIKEPKNKEWVAIYRCYSQFNNGNRGPIFWLNPTLLKMPDEFIISVLHEYGHVIAEYAWVTNSRVHSLLSKYWEGRYYNRPWDEEEFAEEFARFVYSGFSLYDREIKEVIETYVSECLEQS